MPTPEEINRANQQEMDKLQSEVRILRREKECLKRDLEIARQDFKEFGDRLDTFVEELRKAGL